MFAFGAHLLLTLLTLCLFFEILRLLTFTSATPINHLAQRRDDSGPSDGSIHHGITNWGVESSEISVRDFGENVKAAFEDLGNTVKSIFNPQGDKKTPVKAVSEYAYDELDHHISLKELTGSFEKYYSAMKHSDHQMSDEDWVYDQVKNVVPELKKKYDEANKSASASKHHERDAGDKPRPKPGEPEYYTDPSFFPYPMPPTPNITEELKASIGDAFNQWRANTTEVANSSCSAACSKADAITTKVDYTPREKRKEIVEACIKSLIDDPSCLKEYQSTNVLKPYFTELVDKGTIKDEDGVIKKFYRRMVVGGLAHAPEPKPDAQEPIPADSTGGLELLDQYFKELLGNVFKDYKKDIAKHSDMSCPLSKENACENSTLVSAAEANAMEYEERRSRLQSCVIFLSWHPDCLQRYQSTYFIKPYLEDLADRGKITGYAPASSEPGNSTENASGPIARRAGQTRLVNARGHVAPELDLSVNFKGILVGAFKKYKEDIAIHSDMSCPLTKENACENPCLVSGRGCDMDRIKRHEVLEKCVVFLSWHPNCLQKYETTNFIEPYLEDLAESGKIQGYVPGSSEPGNSTETTSAAFKRGTLDAQHDTGTVLPSSAHSEPHAHRSGSGTVKARSILNSEMPPRSEQRSVDLAGITGTYLGPGPIARRAGSRPTVEEIVNHVPQGSLDPVYGQMISDRLSVLLGSLRESKPSTTTGSVGPNATVVQPVPVYVP